RPPTIGLPVETAGKGDARLDAGRRSLHDVGAEQDSGMPTAVEIKKALREAGLEIYLTRGDVVFLADRVRENLLMDAGTYVRVRQVTPVSGEAVGTVQVGFVVRAQRNDFPNESEEHLFVRARALAAPAVATGYGEILAEVRKVLDPGDGQRTLDT